MAEVAHAPSHAAGAPHSVTGIDSRKLLMWIFLASECLFFGALISTYLIFKGDIPFPSPAFITDHLHGREVTGWFPSDRIGPDGTAYAGVLNIPVTSASTFVLLMSSVAMVLAVFGAQNSRPKMMKLWLFATMLLGIIFLGFQVFEFREFAAEGLNLSTNQFGASFFVLTGFHGAHVTVGVLMLGSLLVGSMRRTGLGRESGFHVETVGLYWHFVDIVWIVIFTIIYLMPA
jgi:heme/copper-type cytochrome/quinol oxidase subunit 3